jgi:PAS domain S-box-containing protein
MPKKASKSTSVSRKKPLQAAVSSGSGSRRRTAKKNSGVNTSEDERLRLAIEAAGMAVWEWDMKTNTVIWSHNAHEILGIPKKHFDETFETYLNLVHPEDKKVVIEKINEALESGTVCHIEHRLNWPDGSSHWIESIGKVTFNKKGQAVRITGTIQDISARKKIEYDREDWKHRHELITASAGIVIYDYHIASGNVLWSDNCATVLGYKRKEVNNIDKWIALIHTEDRKERVELLERAQETLQPYDISYRFKKKKGGYIHIRDKGIFVADQNGLASRMLGMMSDVTSTVRTQKSIQESSLFRNSLETAMPGILYVYDVVNLRVVYTNKAIDKYLGYSLEDLKAMKGTSFLQKILHPDDIMNVPVWTTEPAGFTKEREYRVLDRYGKYRWFSTNDTPFKHDADGRVLQVIGIAQDVTSRKEVLDKLSRSEESYLELFDTVGEAIFILQPDSVFLDVNKGAALMYGYSKEDLMGKTPEFLSADGKNDLEEVKRKMELAMQGEPQSFEFWGKKKSGDVFLQEIRLTRGHYFGKIVIIATGWDVTKRLHAEQVARESELRFRTLQSASYGGIGLHDQGFIIDCNQGLSDVTGYPYHELIGRNGLELIAPEWRPYVLEKIKGGYDKPYDVEGLRKDGTRYFLEIHGKNIPYHGRVIRVTEFRDITERKKAEEKIVEQNAKLVALTDDLVRKNNQLEEFTQIVSHNLRSPVGNITTLLSLYENAASEEEQKEYFTLLKESSATTLNMLNDVNDVLKIKQNKNIEKQDLKFQDVLHQVVAMLNAKISQLSAEISADFSGCPEIQYPAIYLESIILNLLDNALKYSHPDRKPEVRFRTYLDRSGNTVMEVSDNGLGLNVSRYGHQLFKLRKTFHKHPESRGIGLFMIKSQIETMGGEITIRSTENEGSTFFVNFNKFQSDGK